MKADVKALWVAALRSGEYKQGTGKLHKVITEDNDGAIPAEPRHEYCCLGVLCDLAMKAGVNISTREAKYSGEYEYVAYNGEENWLPGMVRDWAGIGRRRPSVTYLAMDDDGNEGPLSETLDELNDDYGWDFNQIADAIEDQL